MGFLSDDMVSALRPVFGAGHVNDLLLAFWRARGFSAWPGLEAELAFYRSSGAVGSSFGDVRADYWDRVVRPFADATLWLDAGFTPSSASSVPNLGTGGAVLNAQRGNGSTASTFPTLLQHTGESYVYSPGGSNQVGTSSITAGASNVYDIRVRCAMDDWTPSLEQTFWSYLSGDPNRSVRFTLLTSGAFRVGFHPAGTAAGGVTVDSSATNVFADGSTNWVRVTIQGNVTGSYEVRFFTAPDSPSTPTAWTQLGATATGAGFTFVTTTNLYGTIGANAMEGRLFRVQMASAVGAAPFLDVNVPVDLTSGAATSFVCSTGQTISLTRATAGRKLVAVTRPVWLFGTDDYLEVADNALLNFGATDSFTLLIAGRVWDTASNFGRWFSKRTGTAAGYEVITLNQLNRPYFDIADATVTASVFTPVGQEYVSGGPTAVVAVRNVSSDTIGISNSSTTDTTTGSLSNTVPLRIGRGHGTSDVLYHDMEVLGVAVWRRALSAAEITQVSNYYRQNAT